MQARLARYPVSVRAEAAGPLVVALDQEVVGVPPVEAGEGEDERHDRGSGEQEGEWAHPGASEEQDSRRDHREQGESVGDVAGQAEQEHLMPKAAARARGPGFPVTARASSATDQAATAAKYPSADVPIHTAAGARTRKGAARRARASSASARTRDQHGHARGGADGDAPDARPSPRRPGRSGRGGRR